MRIVATAWYPQQDLTAKPESRAREKIDRQLTDAGWIVQDRAAANLSAGAGVAVREFPLKGGPVDYLLYVDGAAAGAVEAKKEGWTLSGVESQSKRYSEGLPDALPAYRRPLSAATQCASNDNFPAATEAMQRKLYGLSVVVTNSTAAGKALVGDFRGSARIYRTGSASITLHDSQPRDVSGTMYADYRLNQIVIRCEMRAEAVVLRPSGFVRVGPA